MPAPPNYPLSYPKYQVPTSKAHKGSIKGVLGWCWWSVGFLLGSMGGASPWLGVLGILAVVSIVVPFWGYLIGPLLYIG